MKKIIIIICLGLFNIALFSQEKLFCIMDNSNLKNNEILSRTISCPKTSDYWDQNSLYLPNDSQDVIYIKANFIFLTKPDGTGNFEQNNPEHQSFIDGTIQRMNYHMTHLTAPSNSDCYIENPFISNTKIQLIVNKIWKVDPAWDYLVTGYVKGGSINPVYPPSQSYYYSYLDNDPTIPNDGINVVFANNGDVYERLYVNQDYTTPKDLIAQFAASEFPSKYNLTKKSRQFYPDVFNLYTWEKEIGYIERNISQESVINLYKNIIGIHYFPHEFGHTLSLRHTFNCGDEIMTYGFSNKYFNSISQIGKMHRYTSISSVRNYITEDSYTSSTTEVLDNQIWDLDFRLYSDVLLNNQSELKLTCNLILPPQSRIIVKGNSDLKIEGAELHSANNASWNGIKIQDNSSLEILPGTEIDNGYFYAYTDNSLNRSIQKQDLKNSYAPSILVNNETRSSNINISIYPNPSKDFFSLNLNNNQELLGSQMMLVDVSGKILIKQKILVNNTKINAQKLKKGIYYILIGKESEIFIKNE